VRSCEVTVDTENAERKTWLQAMFCRADGDLSSLKDRSVDLDGFQMFLR
jgi:hypothetical protein